MTFGKYKGRGLSKFATEHSADFYAEISDACALADAFADAEKLGLKIAVLGGGSNVFFKHRKIKSAVLKNALPPTITHIGGNLFEVSSSVEMAKLLQFCLKNSRESCYYLASAPCQVGGAIAMNAGGGEKAANYISDFIVSVKFFDGKNVVEKPKEELGFGYRTSAFSDKRCFIISAVFRFPEKIYAENPIAARINWAKQNQDLSAPNCGSLCNRYDAKILGFVRALFAHCPARLSPKKLNWAQNRSKNPAWLGLLFFTIRTLHKVLGKKLKFEIKMFE